MPKRTSDHGKHNRTPLLGGLKDSMNALAADLGLSKPKKHDTNPFGDALQETSERKGGIIDELTRHAVALSPVIKRRTFPELENVPEGLVLGWAQLPSTRGRGFSLGIFPDRDHFAQVAFASTDQPFKAEGETPVPLWRGHGVHVRYVGLEPGE